MFKLIFSSTLILLVQCGMPINHEPLFFGKWKLVKVYHENAESLSEGKDLTRYQALFLQHKNEIHSKYDTFEIKPKGKRIIAYLKNGNDDEMRYTLYGDELVVDGTKYLIRQLDSSNLIIALTYKELQSAPTEEFVLLYQFSKLGN